MKTIYTNTVNDWYSNWIKPDTYQTRVNNTKNDMYKYLNSWSEEVQNNLSEKNDQNTTPEMDFICTLMEKFPTDSEIECKQYYTSLTWIYSDRNFYGSASIDFNNFSNWTVSLRVSQQSLSNSIVRDINFNSIDEVKSWVDSHPIKSYLLSTKDKFLSVMLAIKNVETEIELEFNL